MKAKYIRPEMEISTIVESEMLCLSVGDTPIDGNNGSINSKYRDELWVEDVDLWGNESWTRVE